MLFRECALACGKAEGRENGASPLSGSCMLLVCKVQHKQALVVCLSICGTILRSAALGCIAGTRAPTDRAGY